MRITNYETLEFNYFLNLYALCLLCFVYFEGIKAPEKKRVKNNGQIEIFQ